MGEHTVRFEYDVYGTVTAEVCDGVFSVNAYVASDSKSGLIAEISRKIAIFTDIGEDVGDGVLVGVTICPRAAKMLIDEAAGFINSLDANMNVSAEKTMRISLQS